MQKRIDKIRSMLLDSDPDVGPTCECDDAELTDGWRIVMFQVLRTYRNELSLESQIRETLVKLLDDRDWTLGYKCFEAIVELGREADKEVPNKLE
jgi:hypothetical protein